MSYPGSNITFNLYSADPPTYPVGLGRPNAAEPPLSPISRANAIQLAAVQNGIGVASSQPLPPPSTASAPKADSASVATTTVKANAAPPPPTAEQPGAAGGAALKKSQSLRTPSRVPAPLTIPPTTRGDAVTRTTASAGPGSLSRSNTLSGSIGSNSNLSGSQSAGGLLGSSNPFNDLSSSLQIPSFRPNLSKMGRKISEFGKEVFSLDEEPEMPSRARTPGVGGAAAAALGGDRKTSGGASAVTGNSNLRVAGQGVMAPPLVRSGTAPAPIATMSTTSRSATALAPMAGLPSIAPAIAPLSSAAMTSSASQPVTSATKPIARPATIPEDVPGMGDEPIMCPFCDKPLPPPLIISQLAHLHAAKERGKRASEASLVEKAKEKEKEKVQSRASADAGLSKPAPASDGSAKGLETQKANEPKASAESFLPVVKMSEEAEKAAGAPGSVITDQQIQEWSRRAGLKVEPAGSKVDTAAEAVSLSTTTPSSTASIAIPATAISSTATPKAFPLLPPPPPPAPRTKSPVAPATTTEEAKEKPDGRRGSRFGGLFGKSKGQDKGDDEDESDDDYAQGGYAKLSGPASPERVENRKLELEERRKASPVQVNDEMVEAEVKDGEQAGGAEVQKPSDVVESMSGDAVDEKTDAAIESTAPTSSVAAGGEQDELKKVLQEVLDKVNIMTRSHTDLAASHNSLLTSLKIARSNLVMAEANAEMLEEQLRRASVHQPVPVRSSVESSVIPPRSSSSAPRNSEPSATAGRRSLEEARQPAGPVAAVKGAAKPRPNSLIIPASALFETGPMTGPASTRAAADAAAKSGQGANANSAGSVFGGFFGGKTLSSLNIPTAQDLQARAQRLGDSLAGQVPSRPGTPISGGLALAGAASGGGMGYAHAQSTSHLRADAAAKAPPTPTVREPQKSPAQFFDYHMPSPPLTQGSPSPGGGTSPSNTSTPLARPTLSPAHSAQFATEFAKLRNAYASSQARMETMAKELTDLKKGKIEMEAELETLSQALFEEANKMVADERRKRLESEEQLKEIKEEKEVLKETIKVLGGKDKDIGPEVKVSSEEDRDKDKEKKDENEVDIDSEEWKPRDLDKHYEALRKTIHHVADGASPNTAVLGDGTSAFADAVTYSGTSREFEAALDEVQAAAEAEAEAEGVLDFTPVGVDPMLELSPALPTHDRATEQEVNPWAEVDFSGASNATARKASHGFGVDPLDGGRRESLGLNLRGVDFGEGLDGSAIIEPPKRANPEEKKEEEPMLPKASLPMRRTSSA